MVNKTDRQISKRSYGLLVVLAVIVFAAATSGPAAAAKCKKVSGKFTLQTVSGPECLSPVGVCANGVYTGDIAGTSFFIGSSFIATADSPLTGVFLLTGDNSFQTRRGSLATKDAIVLRTTGTGDFAEDDTIIGGTGEWAGVTGYFTATGTFGESGGQGEYTGQVCSE